MSVDLAVIGEFFTENNLWDKPFGQFDQQQILRLVGSVHEATDYEAGWQPPYIEKGNLVIPFNAPKKYQWWQGGQRVWETLNEIGATEETLKRYRPIAGGDKYQIVKVGENDH